MLNSWLPTGSLRKLVLSMLVAVATLFGLATASLSMVALGIKITGASRSLFYGRRPNLGLVYVLASPVSASSSKCKPGIYDILNLDDLWKSDCFLSFCAFNLLLRFCNSIGFRPFATFLYKSKSSSSRMDNSILRPLYNPF